MRQLLGIVVGPEMDEEQPRLLIKHVAVVSGHLDGPGAQGTDQWVHFVARDEKIARDGRLAAAGGKLMAWARPMAVATVMPPSVGGSSARNIKLVDTAVGHHDRPSFAVSRSIG